jgi:hypothetical protein
MMLRRRATSATLAVVSFTVIAVASAGTAAPPTLKGTDGPSFTISLKKNGKAVKSLTAGRYKFVISDKSSAHGFTLKQVKGGKWKKTLTAVPLVATKSITVALRTGKWKFYCPPHESGMFGFFTVK